MKFLCMTCDTQMKTVENRRQLKDGTLAIVLECPECFDQIGMLTNPMARRGVETFARQNGHALVTPQVLDEARAVFGM